MKKGISLGVAAVFVATVGASAGVLAAEGKGLRVMSDQTVTGFAFPESVACDAKNKALYMSRFGSKLAPAEKDGKGYISKLSLDGKVVDERFLPAHGETLHKPKGIWVRGDRLWVTDIDVLWVFDLKSRKGRKLELRGITFANDPAILGNSIYVSDNRADLVYRVEPADFLNSKVNPQVSIPAAGKKMYPNGLWPARDGSLVIGGFQSPKEPRGLYQMSRDGEIKTLADQLGRIDGVYQLKDGSLLVTDWNSGSLARWSAKGGMQPLAKGFKGPADFCVIESGKGMTAYVPDLVQSQLRIIRLAN
jgi:hypothetical protein